MMDAPFGIAVYPDRGKSTLAPLPHIRATRTLNESQYGLVEDSGGRLITTHYQHERQARYADATRERTSTRGLPGRETAGVRRRPTTVRRELADAIMVRLIEERQRFPRSRLARYMGVTTRHLHLAELGSVQPDAVGPIAAYLGIEVTHGL